MGISKPSTIFINQHDKFYQSQFLHMKAHIQAKKPNSYRQTKNKNTLPKQWLGKQETNYKKRETFYGHFEGIENNVES